MMLMLIMTVAQETVDVVAGVTLAACDTWPPLLVLWSMHSMALVLFIR